MKTYWKWIIGIIIALAVIVAAMFGMRYLVSNGTITLPANLNAWRGPMMGRGFEGPRAFDGRGFNGYRGGPMMGGRGIGFGHFGPLIFLGGLLRLVFFGALLYGAYWLGRRNARIAIDSKTVAPAIEPDATPKRGGKVAKS